MKKVKQIHKKSEKLTPTQIWQFLEDYASMIQGQDKNTKAISIRVPANVLTAFQFKAKKEKLKYQSQIIKLMREWSST